MDDLDARQAAIDALARALKEQGFTVEISDRKPELTASPGHEASMIVGTKKLTCADGGRLYFVENPGCHVMTPIDNIGRAVRFIQHLLS